MNLRKRFSLDETRSSRAPIVQIHDTMLSGTRSKSMISVTGEVILS
jgi:hypothetical protein